MPEPVLKSIFKWVVEQEKAALQKKNAEREAYLTSKGYEVDHEDQDERGAIKPYTLITPEEVALRYGVPEEDLINFLGNEVEKSESCQSLPFTLLLVFSYALMVINHDLAPWVNAVEDSIGFDITENANFAFSSDFMGFKNIDDVNSHADFWSWLARGFLPLIFNQRYQLAEGRNWDEPYVQQAAEFFDRRDRGVLLNYNRIVLGVRLSQERDLESDVAKTGKCPYAPMQPAYDKDCVGGIGSYELEPEVLIARKTTNPRREHWFYIHDDMEFVRQQIVSMEHNYWLDNRTQKVELAIPVYNAEYGLHTLIHCNFFFSRGGHIWKAIIPLSAFAKNFKSWHNYLYDFTWLICLLVIIVQEVLEILFVVKEYGGGGVMKQYAGFWNFIDWSSIAAGFGIVFMEYVNTTQTSKMNSELEALGKLDEDLQRAEYRDKGKDYFLAMEKQVHYSYSFRVVLAGYPLVIVFRLFKAFGAQPRLAVVTKTLVTARVDLVHFMLIFMSVFICYAIAGVVLFGREIASFTTVFRAFITCGRLMFGDFDWGEMKEVGRSDAFFWFVPFTILIVWILLNMLMAIVMDSYSEVTANMPDKETLWTQAKKTWKQKIKDRRGETVNLKVLLTKLKKYVKEMEKQRAQEALETESIESESEQGFEWGRDEQQGMNEGIVVERFRRDQLGYAIATHQSSTDFSDVQPGGSRRDANELDLSTPAWRPEWTPRPQYAYSDRSHSSALTSDKISKFMREEQQKNAKPTPIMTVAKLKELFPGGDLSSSQAKHVIRDAINAYYSVNKTTSSMDEVITSINKVDYMTRRLRKRTQARLRRQGGAQANPVASGRLFRESFQELRGARFDLTDWVDEDKKDVPLPAELFLTEKLASREATGDEAPISRSLSSLPTNSLRSREASGVYPGGNATILSDEHTVIAACRAAGIGPRYDDLRRMSLGRDVHVERCDDKDGTVLCAVEGVGSVWFPTAAFASKESPLGSAREEENLTEEQRRVRALEEELKVGKETIAMGMHTMREQKARLEELQALKREEMHMFKETRHEAVELTRENTERRVRFKYNQERLEQLIDERDEYFERVKSLVAENKRLEMRLGASDENGHNGYNGYNGNGYNGNGNRVHPLENGRYDDMDDPDSLV
mmetsp:Transcript_26997/g.46862  ORF Transcript_26997/g.46862 Transcript_26997/m.46862 type:complete len:1137 (-) Transcript_26997:83-3493(-)